jgi:toxin ParE1/3/4
MSYAIVLDPRAIRDVQDAIDYYDDEQVGLGQKFEKALNRHLIALEKNPFFQNRYSNVHCLPLKKFPYMVHFTIDEKQQIVTVRAVFHTAQDLKEWNKRRQRDSKD